MRTLENRFGEKLWKVRRQINALKDEGGAMDTIAKRTNLLLAGMSVIEGAYNELLRFKEIANDYVVRDVVRYDFDLSEEAEAFYKQGAYLIEVFTMKLQGRMYDVIPMQVRTNLLMLTDKMLKISARWHIERMINVFELTAVNRAFPQRKPLLEECIFFADRMNATKMGIEFDDGIMPKVLIFSVQPNAGKSFISNVYSLMASCLHTLYYNESGILRMSNNTANAIGFSNQIKAMIEDEKIADIYPEFKKYFKTGKPTILEKASSEEWKMQGLDPRIRATYFARGRDTAINSIRVFVALIIDDLSDGFDQMNNDEAHQAMYTKFEVDMDSRKDNEDIPTLVVGTMFNEFDVPNTMIKKLEDNDDLVQSDRFKNVRHSRDFKFVVVAVDCFDEHGESRAPRLISTSKLKEKQNSLKPYEFDLVYRQFRASREPRIFEYNNLKTYKQLPSDLKPQRKAVMDPTRKNGADYFSLPVFAERPADGLSYFVDCIYEQKSLGKLNDPTNSFLRKCINFLINNNVAELIIENNTNNTIGMIFDEEFKKKGHNCKITEVYTTKIKGPKSSKTERILQQEPTIVNNIVFPAPSCYPPLHHITQFMTDFTRYDSKLSSQTKKQHDDAPDSVAIYSDKCLYNKNNRYSVVSGISKKSLWR